MTSIVLGLASAHAQGEVNISPIVQVISYSDIYGKYPQMMWWWSASVINKNWVIISNDHVVDAGNGALASAFSVCVTKEVSKKPVCDYTASLIARDEKLDISLLKIDPTDIYGNPVDYTKFKTIDIDFNYEPKNQDETIAIGYPWVGADTISETKWIVSGVSEYNGYRYIKTDTLIAGGNSGGAFIKDGKLIWVPTFGMWGWWENTMGYALLIKEAESFISENIHQSAQSSSITKLIDFNSYRKTIESINSNFVLKDDVFEMSFPDDYQISNYIKNIYFTLELKKQKDTGISSFWVYLEKAPNIKNDKEKFYYFESAGYYSKDWQKLVKKTIGWIEYYYPVDKSDLSNGNSNWWNRYFTIENGYLINIYIQAPFYDEKRNKEVKQEVEKVLWSLNIKKENFSRIETSFSTNVPKIDIKNLKNAITDTGKYKFYLGNLYENFEIYLNELIEYNGKGKTAQEIYDVQLKDVDESLKTMIHFKWYDWYINCGNSSISSYYNYYNYYGNSSMYVDENGNPISLETCEINIYFPLSEDLNRQNYLSLKLTSLTTNKERNLSLAIEFLKRFLKVPALDQEINMPNILKTQTKLKFKDIQNQTTQYKNFLKILVRYWMLENTAYFQGNKPVTWWEYLDLYTKYVLNIKTDTSACRQDYNCKFSKYSLNGKNLDTTFKELWIDNYSEYVDISKTYNFETLLTYKLAWVDLAGEYDMSHFLTFQNLIDEESHVKEKQKINDFNNVLYGSRKILLSDFYSNYNSYFFTLESPRYYSDKKILAFVKNNDERINFWNTPSPLDKELNALYKTYQCYKKATYNEYYNCNKEYDQKYLDIQKKYAQNKDILGLESDWYFTPMTKADALNSIFSQVDFSLFDEKLAQKKETTIDEATPVEETNE